MFQFGLVRDSVTASSSTLGFKILKDLACDFINRKAALGCVVVDFARKEDPVDVDKSELASQVLTIAVLYILLTGTFGAVGICVAGPRLLQRTVPQQGRCSP
ncbi:hypothetical protein L798_02812 [Zootermopsis nevadensis]|uniref:Serine/threonine-protein kinase D1-3-like ubiquitin-like domain-containing protein n=1 Tax=Zootermopsis nevadensis TaxID=136037 RepID=A0A067QU65_ZOONE|nr:hypothetical protein L798_02812 [Zootermopsis nevadensis]